MSIRFEVKSVEIKERKGVGKRSGKPFEFMEQSAYMDVGKAYPVEVKFILDGGVVPFEPGQYELTSQCFYVDRFGGVQVDLSKAKAVPSALVGGKPVMASPKAA